MNVKIKTPYTFTAFGGVIYFAVLAFCLTLMLTRNNHDLWQHINVPGLNSPGSHLSNFAISMLLLFVAGVSGMLTKTSWKLILLYACIMTAANVAVELFVPILNTKDITDAFYGLAGIVVTLLLLYLMQAYGMRKSGRG